MNKLTKRIKSHLSSQGLYSSEEHLLIASKNMSKDLISQTDCMKKIPHPKISHMVSIERSKSILLKQASKHILFFRLPLMRRELNRLISIRNSSCVYPAVFISSYMAKARNLSGNKPESLKEAINVLISHQIHLYRTNIISARQIKTSTSFLNDEWEDRHGICK